MYKLCLTLAACLLMSIPVAAAQETPLVDRYGQYIGEDWPGKITSDAQLQADAAKERPMLANVKFDSAHFDQYGGKLEGKPLAATGYFRTQKIDGRWWLITPFGNRFFMQGVDAVGYTEGGYSTPLVNPDGSTRTVFQDLPDKGAFPEAYSRANRINFIAANLQRKYGTDYRQVWRDITYKRLLAWGFNSTGQWGWQFTLGMPYVEDMTFANVRRINREIDPFDPAFATQVAKDVLTFRPECKTDPMLIGYACENEDGWDQGTLVSILQLGSDSPAKRAFITFLMQRHNNNLAEVAALFNQPGMSRDELLARPLDINNVPESDWKGFIIFASETYHAIVAKAMKAYDPHHLFLGGAHCGHQSIEWIAGSAKYVDAIALHDYSLYADWINSHMSTYRQLDKPLMILEYSFVVKGRGMRLYNTNNTVMTQQQRGLGYRLFTEQLAANPLVVGFGWFIYYDQPVTMRSLPSGENFNFGLVNQCDQPYDDMITEVKKSNTRLFSIHQGARKPISEKKTGVLIERQSYAMPTMRELKIPYKQLTSLAGALKDCSGMKSITVKKSNDLSVVYYLAWDEQQLYLVAKVIDDVFSNNETPDRIWNCDGIEVWINENQFGLAALGANCTPQSYCWKGQHQGELGVVQVAFTRRDNLGADADMQHAFGHSVKNAPGWVLAAAIPWSAVLDKAPGNQQHLHLAIGVDDSDTHGEPGDRDAQVYFPKHWSWGAVNTFQDTVLEK